jgi:hypothetical protein
MESRGVRTGSALPMGREGRQGLREWRMKTGAGFASRRE